MQELKKYIETSFVNNSNIMYIVFAVLLHFITVNTNYISDTAGCEYIKFFEKNIFIKHVIGFIVMLVFVVLNIDVNTHSKYVILFITVMSYSIFVLSSRTHFPHGLIIYGLLGIAYMLNIYKTKINREAHKTNKKILRDKIITENRIEGVLDYIDYDNGHTIDNKNISTITTAQHYIVAIAIVALLIFSVSYIIQKYLKHRGKPDFSVLKLIFGGHTC